MEVRVKERGRKRKKRNAGEDLRGRRRKAKLETAVRRVICIYPFPSFFQLLFIRSIHILYLLLHTYSFFLLFFFPLIFLPFLSFSSFIQKLFMFFIQIFLFKKFLNNSIIRRFEFCFEHYLKPEFFFKF